MVRAKSMALVNSGRILIRVLIFSEKTGSQPASFSASSWLWSSCWAVLHLAFEVSEFPTGQPQVRGSAGSNLPVR